MADVSFFADHDFILGVAVNLVLIGAGWGKMFTQVREVIKWKESKENDPLSAQLNTGLIKQAEVFERFSEHFERLDDQIKDLTKEPVELGLTKLENRMLAEIRECLKDYTDKKSVDLRFEMFEKMLEQLDHRIKRDADHIKMILDRVLEMKKS